MTFFALPSPAAPTLRRLGACLLLAAAFAPAPAHGQTTRADSAAVLLEAARDFEADGAYETSDALLAYIMERFGGTAAAAAAAELLLGPASDRVDPVSRIEIPVFATTYGLWLGVAVPAAFGADDSEAYGAGLLLGGPLGLFSGMRYARGRRLSAGQARAVSWGGTYGTWLGFGWTELLDLGVDELCDEFGCFDTESRSEERFAGMVIGGLAGIGTGALLARGPVRSGVASAAQGGSIWGSVYGAMVARVLDDTTDGSTLGAALVSGKVGLLGGALLAAKYDVSRDRVRMINLGALVGGLGGLGIDLLVQPDDTETGVAIPLVTSVAGAILATATTSDRPRASEADDGEGAEYGSGQGAALFGWSEGSLTIQPPLPMPTVIPIDDPNGRPSWTPGVAVELFRTSFR